MSVQPERRSTRRIDCYDHSLRDINIKHSLVVDISTFGAGLLLQKEQQPNISDEVHLTIFHPDTSLDEALGIDAEVAWVDNEHSSDQSKMGLKFINVNSAQAAYVSKLMEWLAKEGHYFLHCELENH